MCYTSIREKKPLNVNNYNAVFFRMSASPNAFYAIVATKDINFGGEVVPDFVPYKDNCMNQNDSEEVDRLNFFTTNTNHKLLFKPAQQNDCTNVRDLHPGDKAKSWYSHFNTDDLKLLHTRLLHTNFDRQSTNDTQNYDMTEEIISSHVFAPCYVQMTSQRGLGLFVRSSAVVAGQLICTLGAASLTQSAHILRDKELANSFPSAHSFSYFYRSPYCVGLWHSLDCNYMNMHTHGPGTKANDSITVDQANAEFVRVDVGA